MEATLTSVLRVPLKDNLAARGYVSLLLITGGILLDKIHLIKNRRPNPEALDFRVIFRVLNLRNAMIEELLQQEEGKTLEFKENSKSLGKIIIGRRGPSIRKSIAEYPPLVMKEAVTHAWIHTDYTAAASQIQVAIFDDRIEITNPGALPVGLNLQDALQEIFQLRNRVIGRCLRAVEWIELWGSGLKQMISQCQKSGTAIHRLEELGHFFRVTLFNRKEAALVVRGRRKDLMDLIAKRKEVIRPKYAHPQRQASRGACARSVVWRSTSSSSK